MHIIAVADKPNVRSRGMKHIIVTAIIGLQVKKASDMLFAFSMQLYQKERFKKKSGSAA